MKIAILGANGFLGQALSKRLALESGCDLILFSRTISSDLRKLESYSHINIVQGDYKNGLDVLPVIKNQDIVFHLISNSVPSSSWLEPGLEIEFNLLPTIKLFQLCAESGVSKIVFTSSGGTVYGDKQVCEISENFPLKPFSPHGITKVAIEHYLNYFKRKSGLNYDIYRISNLYGLGQKKVGFGVINTWLRAAKNDEPLKLFGNGENVKDYIFIDDAVELMMNSLSDLDESQVYNLCSGMGISLNAIIDIIKAITDKKISVVKRPSPLSDNRMVILSNQKLLLQNPDFNMTPLQVGIKRVWDSINSQSKM